MNNFLVIVLIFLQNLVNAFSLMFSISKGIAIQFSSKTNPPIKTNYNLCWTNSPTYFIILLFILVFNKKRKKIIKIFVFYRLF